jgi:hypothetical protein
MFILFTANSSATSVSARSSVYRVLELLSRALSEGYLALDEFEHRSDQVNTAKLVSELTSQVKDLPLQFHWEPTINRTINTLLGQHSSLESCPYPHRSSSSEPPLRSLPSSSVSSSGARHRIVESRLQDERDF